VHLGHLIGADDLDRFRNAATEVFRVLKSVADDEYYGIDAFVFVNKAGARQAVRYQMVPTASYIWSRLMPRDGRRIS
jgi:hypothetical protein